MKSSITETFKLPSLGKLDGISPEVTMRSMTTFEEKLRLGSKGKFFKTISGIINRCVVSPENFDSYSLTLQDFIYLFYQLRIVTYGNMYKVNTTCQHCRSKFSETVDLNSLPVNYIDDNFSEPINIVLPRSQDKIGLRLLRTYEIDEIATEADNILASNKDYEGDPSYEITLSHKINTINGKETNPITITKYIQDMEAIDGKYIDHKYDQITFGVDIAIRTECPHCGRKVEYLLPVGETFFRPQFDD